MRLSLSEVNRIKTRIYLQNMYINRNIELYLLIMTSRKKVGQCTIAEYWLDTDGILYGVSKDAPRTIETLKENFDLINKITGRQKVCGIYDLTNTRAYDIETFNYLQQELACTFKAIGYVARSPVGNVLSFMSCYMVNAPMPVKMFESREEARKWILQFVK